MSRVERLLLPALLLLIPAAGCRDREPEGDAPTIDVPPALTVDTSNDPRAGEEVPVLIGVLPNDFPADLPIYVPASLIDFGVSDRGLRSVSLLSPHPLWRVRQELEKLMRQRGWTAEENGAHGTRWRKEAEEVWLQLENARPGTLYVFEY